MTYKHVKDCLNCQKDECDNCKQNARIRDWEKNKEYCRKYYQAHKEEAKERVRRARMKQKLRLERMVELR